MEWLTTEIEKMAWEYLERIKEEGGFIRALESSFFLQEAVKGTMDKQRKISSGEMKVIGVNCFQMEEEPHKVTAFRHNPKAWEIAMERLETLRRKRDPDKAARAMDRLRKACEGDENVMPAMMEAIKSYVTVGEIDRIFRETFGTWDPPKIFL